MKHIKKLNVKAGDVAKEKPANTDSSNKSGAIKTVPNPSCIPLGT